MLKQALKAKSCNSVSFLKEYSKTCSSSISPFIKAPKLIVLRTLPYELNLAIEGINNQHRQTILFALSDVDRMSFSDLQKQVNIKKALLANHLRELSRTLLVEHFYDHKIDDDAYSYYRISKMGRNLLRSLLTTLFGTIEENKTQTTCYVYTIRREETTTRYGSVFKPNSKNPVSVAVESVKIKTPNE